MRSSIRPLSIFLILASIVLAGCGNTTGAAAPTAAARYTVAPRFEPYYRDHGGAETLADPISAEIQEGDKIYQYFVNGRLEYDTITREVWLSPLGLEFEKSDPPGAVLNDPTAKCFEARGHCVKDLFLPYFEQYGDVFFFGYPITDVKAEDGRLVQHFERATIVWDKSLPENQRVHMAPLGLLKCAQVNCQVINSTGPGTGDPGAGPTQAVGPIPAFVARHGGPDVFGVAISELLVGPDGAMEQFYENAVFFVDATAPEGVSLRRLGLDHRSLDPAAAPTIDPSGIYDPATGHNLLSPFRQFYDEHGGYIVFGHPISEMQIKGGILIQYFETVRMEWHSGALKGSEVQLTGYGREEWDRLAGLPQPAPEPAITPLQSLAIKVWADWPILAAGQAQTLNALVTDDQQIPINGATVSVVVHTSGGDLNFVLPPTGGDGRTSVTFSLPAWQAGEFVIYEMTAQYGDVTSSAAMDNFVQWYGATPTGAPAP